MAASGADSLASFLKLHTELSGRMVPKALLPMETREVTKDYEDDSLPYDTLVGLSQQRSQSRLAPEPPAGPPPKRRRAVRPRPTPQPRSSAVPSDDEEDDRPAAAEQPAKRRRNTGGIRMQMRRGKHVAEVVSDPDTHDKKLHVLIRKAWAGPNHQTVVTRDSIDDLERATKNCTNNGDPNAYFVVLIGAEETVVGINPQLFHIVELHLPNA